MCMFSTDREKGKILLFTLTLFLINFVNLFLNTLDVWLYICYYCANTSIEVLWKHTFVPYKILTVYRAEHKFD